MKVCKEAAATHQVIGIWSVGADLSASASLGRVSDLPEIDLNAKLALITTKG